MPSAADVGRALVGEGALDPPAVRPSFVRKNSGRSPATDRAALASASPKPLN